MGEPRGARERCRFLREPHRVWRGAARLTHCGPAQYGGGIYGNYGSTITVKGGSSVASNTAAEVRSAALPWLGRSSWVH